MEGAESQNSEFDGSYAEFHDFPSDGGKLSGAVGKFPPAVASTQSSYLEEFSDIFWKYICSLKKEYISTLSQATNLRTFFLYWRREFAQENPQLSPAAKAAFTTLSFDDVLIHWLNDKRIMLGAGGKISYAFNEVAPPALDEKQFFEALHMAKSNSDGDLLRQRSYPGSHVAGGYPDQSAVSRTVSVPGTQVSYLPTGYTPAARIVQSPVYGSAAYASDPRIAGLRAGQTGIPVATTGANYAGSYKPAVPLPAQPRYAAAPSHLYAPAAARAAPPVYQVAPPAVPTAVELDDTGKRELSKLEMNKGNVEVDFFSMDFNYETNEKITCPVNSSICVNVKIRYVCPPGATNVAYPVLQRVLISERTAFSCKSRLPCPISIEPSPTGDVMILCTCKPVSPGIIKNLYVFQFDGFSIGRYVTVVAVGNAASSPLTNVIPSKSVVDYSQPSLASLSASLATAPSVDARKPAPTGISPWAQGSQKSFLQNNLVQKDSSSELFGSRDAYYDSKGLLSSSRLHQESYGEAEYGRELVDNAIPSAFADTTEPVEGTLNDYSGLYQDFESMGLGRVGDTARGNDFLFSQYLSANAGGNDDTGVPDIVADDGGVSESNVGK